MDTLPPKPDCFDAWFTIAFAVQETAGAGDLSKDIVEARLSGRRLFSQHIGSLDLVRIEEQRGIEVGTGPAKPHQMGDAPRHHEVQCQGAFNAFDGAQLQRRDPAGIFEYVKQNLDFPPCAVPVDQLGDVRSRVGAAIGQQPPFDGFHREKFVNARARLYQHGWRADPGSHASSGEYIGLDRLLVQKGYIEVDYCSVGKSFCILQYVKGDACLRVQTQGEQIQAMRIERWSIDCRQRGADEQTPVPPADVRYLAQWKDDCENFGQCRGFDAYLRAARKKYARDPEVTKVLSAYQSPLDVKHRARP